MKIAPLRCADRGPHPVGVRTLSAPDPDDPGRTLPIDLWYPADPSLRGQDQPGTAPHGFGQPHAALPDAPAAAGSLPVVLFSHGNSGLRQQSTFLTTHLASHGIAVVAPDHVGNTFPEMARIADEDERKRLHFEARRNRPRDLLTALDTALADALVGARLDAERVGVLGHSYGGYTALKAVRADARVRVVCGLAPASEPFVGRRAFEPDELPLDRGVPALLVAGRNDVLVDLATSVRPLFDRLAAPRALVSVDGADHFHFCDGIPLLHGMHERNPRPNQHAPTRALAELLPEARMQRLLAALVTAWFRNALEDGAGDPLACVDPAALAAVDVALARVA